MSDSGANGNVESKIMEIIPVAYALGYGTRARLRYTAVVSLCIALIKVDATALIAT